MSNNPFFSVILPVFNREKRIERAINSILTQEFENWELIIINDASTDRTKQILDKIINPKIRVFHNDTNKERCVTRNIGIKQALGEFICFLDSDDYHLPFHLKKLHDLIVSKNNKIAMYFSNSFNETETGIRTDRFCPDFTEKDPFHYFLNYTVNPQRWAIHKSIFEKVTFDPAVIICEDMDTSMRIVANGYPIYQLQERTTVYVAANDSFTHGDSQKWEKELFYLKRIFNKSELKGNLRVSSKWRLLSMCYFHLAEKANKNKNQSLSIKFSLKSLFYYPRGYNKQTLKPLIVILLYNFPILGRLIQLTRNLWKKESIKVN